MNIYIKDLLCFLFNHICQKQYKKITEFNVKLPNLDFTKINPRESFIEPIHHLIPANLKLKIITKYIFNPWYTLHVYNSKFSTIQFDPLELFQQSNIVPIEYYESYLEIAIQSSKFIEKNIDCLIITILVYLDRLQCNLKNKYGTTNVFYDTNILYLFIISFCLTIKYYYDDYDHINVGFIIQHIFNLKLPNSYKELEFLFLNEINHNLYISSNDYLKYHNILLEVLNSNVLD